MSEIVNLRQARKAKRRATAEGEAVASRLRHGRTRGERTGQAMRLEQARRLLDGALLDGIRLDDAPGGVEGQVGDTTTDHDE